MNKQEKIEYINKGINIINTDMVLIEQLKEEITDRMDKMIIEAREEYLIKRDNGDNNDK